MIPPLIKAENPNEKIMAHLALVIPISYPEKPDQGLPTQPPQAGQLPTPPSAGGTPSHPISGGGAPSQPIYIPGSPDQGLPPMVAFPIEPPTGGAPSHPTAPVSPGSPAHQPSKPPGRPDQGPADKPGRPDKPSNELPSGGIPIVGPPVYIEGNPPMIGWELPEQPSHKPTPTPPAQPKK